jgi:hypothetical protein
MNFSLTRRAWNVACRTCSGNCRDTSLGYEIRKVLAPALARRRECRRTNLAAHGTRERVGGRVNASATATTRATATA